MDIWNKKDTVQDLITLKATLLSRGINELWISNLLTNLIHYFGDNVSKEYIDELAHNVCCYDYGDLAELDHKSFEKGFKVGYQKAKEMNI